MTPEPLEADLVRYFADQERACTRLPDLARHLAGELTAHDADAMSEHVHRCLECRSTIDELTQTAAAWRAPAAVLTHPRGSYVRPAVMALAAALLAFVITRVTEPDAERLTPKGTWSLEVAVQRGGEQFLAPSGAKLQTGDQLGLFYSSASDGWLTVLYVDPKGPPVRVFPARSAGSAKVTAGDHRRLDDGAVLGEGQGCEWVVGVFSKVPLAAGEAEQLVTKLVEGRKGCTLADAPGGSKADVRVVVVNR